MVAELASSLAAAYVAPDAAAEAARAEALDRICADLDVQIGLTIVKPDSAPIAGTRLRGVAEAAGFHLGPGGRFDYVNDENGAVEYSLHNMRNEPFTADSLRLTATNGVVFLLDVPRLPDPVRSFDRMKLAAKRMAHTLGGELVDDNQRPLDDAALAAIRAQVEAAAAALARGYIEPGSARALALFGA
jgi:FtsZ-interacting cell division protein ZipA